MFTKTTETRCKVLDAGERSSDGTVAKTSGQVEMIVSVFGNKDSYGDIVQPGAFERTLGEWQDRGDPIPVYYAHKLDDPMMNIGWSLDAHEIEAKDGRPAGLWALTQMDMDNPTATQSLKLMRERRLTGASFSFTLGPDGEKYIEPADPEADPFVTGDWGHYDLVDLSLHEYGPCPVGANPEATVLPMKSGGHIAVPTRLIVAASKVGKVLSAKNLTALNDAKDLIAQVIADAGSADPAAGDAKPPKVNVVPRRASVTVTSRAFGDQPPAGDAPAPTMDDVKGDVQAAADSLASALDGFGKMSGKTVDSEASTDGKATAEDQGLGTPEGVKAEGQGVNERARLLTYADSLTLGKGPLS